MPKIDLIDIDMHIKNLDRLDAKVKTILANIEKLQKIIDTNKPLRFLLRLFGGL